MNLSTKLQIVSDLKVCQSNVSEFYNPAMGGSDSISSSAELLSLLNFKCQLFAVFLLKVDISQDPNAYCSDTKTCTEHSNYPFTNCADTGF